MAGNHRNKDDPGRGQESQGLHRGLHILPDEEIEHCPDRGDESAQMQREEQGGDDPHHDCQYPHGDGGFIDLGDKHLEDAGKADDRALGPVEKDDGDQVPVPVEHADDRQHVDADQDQGGNWQIGSHQLMILQALHVHIKKYPPPTTYVGS